MLNKKEIRKQLSKKFNPRLASVSDLNEIRGDRFKKNSVYDHENMDLIDITEGAIYNTWKELINVNIRMYNFVQLRFLTFVIFKFIFNTIRVTSYIK